MKRWFFSQFIVTSCFLSLPCQAVIVAGANGANGSTNNTTQAQLEAHSGIAAPIFNHVVSYSDSTGVYLGYNPDTDSVWVLTARHVFPSTANATIDGNTYSHVSRTIISGSDLALIRYSGVVPPSLNAIRLATSSPAVSTPLTMIGRGQNRDQAGSVNPLISDAFDYGGGVSGYGCAGSNVMRWGTNHVDFFPETDSLTISTLSFSGLGYSTQAFAADFDIPVANWTTSNEAIGSGGDSGGGAFTLNAGQWTLSGLISAADRYHVDENGNGSIQTNELVSVFNDPLDSYTYFTDIASYRPQILAITGNLVPEPSTLLFFGLLSLGVACKRHRNQPPLSSSHV